MTVVNVFLWIALTLAVGWVAASALVAAAVVSSSRRTDRRLARLAAMNRHPSNYNGDAA